ncbi:MAG TPA: serine hydrolase domain-containing protein [Longimicrobiales bacterium]|nr:serine hydrolase domain-containing protein [Longimicrobiales bacterium]
MLPVRRLPPRAALLAALLLFPLHAAAQAPSRDAAIDSLRARLRRDVAADDVGGITAAIVLGDRVIWAEGFGWADRERHVPAAVGTLYRIGSISKSITAAAMMRLAERRVLALDDPVTRWLPEAGGFPRRFPGAPPITLRNLASHTAGLAREPHLADAAAGPIAGWEAKVVASIPTTDVDTLPGARFAYSNIGFGVLGLAISRAAHRPFMELVRDEVFTPLGMSHTTFVVPPALLPDLATGYANGRDGSVDVATPAREQLGRGYKVPNGGVYSTVLDLARFLAGMSAPGDAGFLTAASRAEMTRPQTPPGREDAYGLGFFLRATTGGRRLVAHSGSVAGYTAYVAFDPASRAGIVLLRNYDRGRTDLAKVADAALLALDARPAAAATP